jgi:purine-binding chemotaxis protein CheW
MSMSMGEARQYCTFLLERQLYGIRVDEVQEVIRYQETTRVPLAPAAVRGLINLRGQIVTAIDLRRVLGLPERDSGRPTNVVVRTEDGAVSLLVDEIGDVLEAGEDCFERPPDTLSSAQRELIVGAYKLEQRLMLVLDVQRTIGLVTAA